MYLLPLEIISLNLKTSVIFYRNDPSVFLIFLKLGEQKFYIFSVFLSHNMIEGI